MGLGITERYLREEKGNVVGKECIRDADRSERRSAVPITQFKNL